MDDHAVALAHAQTAQDRRQSANLALYFTNAVSCDLARYRPMIDGGGDPHALLLRDDRRNCNRSLHQTNGHTRLRLH